MHPNRITTRFSRESLEQARAEAEETLRYRGVSAPSWAPYVSRLVEARAEQAKDGKIYVVFVEEPVRPEEALQYMRRGDRPGREPWDLQPAYEVAAELAQRAWYDGLPADAKVFCAAHQSERQAHGANRYDEHLLCNQCVLELEQLMIRRPDTSPRLWIERKAASGRVEQALDAAESKGEGAYHLADDRWADIEVLYSQGLGRFGYGDERPAPAHWPEGFIPRMYQLYIRSSSWQPGSEFDLPEMQILATTRDKAATILHDGPEALSLRRRSE